MSVLPFICLGIGITLGLFIKSSKLANISDKISTIALVFLMLTIGIGIGLDESIVKNFIKIGFNCLIISISALGFSILFTLICEKTILPLNKIDNELQEKNISLVSINKENDKNGGSPLVWLMPISLILGLVSGVVFRSNISELVINSLFTLSLIILYICVGISQGTNKEVFHFVKLLGFKIVWLSVAILAGSILGGIFAGLILQLPLHISLVSSCGMSFYSITGAYMTNTYGVEVGTYGFIVNVMREFFTVLLLPILIKISPGSPLAAGAAGNMDTLLAPITKFVGVRLGLVTLITGTILTFIVPFLLPLVTVILN